MDLAFGQREAHTKSKEEGVLVHPAGASLSGLGALSFLWASNFSFTMVFYPGKCVWNSWSFCNTVTRLGLGVILLNILFKSSSLQHEVSINPTQEIPSRHPKVCFQGLNELAFHGQSWILLLPTQLLIQRC